MNLLIIGLGSIGRRHAKILNQYFPQYKLFALRSGHSKDSLPYVTDIYEMKDLIRLDPRAVFICTPTDQHVGMAYGICLILPHTPIFIEKPLSVSLNTKCLFRNHNQVIYTAYPFRFHPHVKAIKKRIGNDPIKMARFECSTWLPSWGKAYSMKRETGGGALLELSHEIDLAQYLCGKIERIEGICGKAFDVTDDCEDWASLTLFHQGGNESKVRLDLASRFEHRTLEIATQDYWCKANMRESGDMDWMYVDQMKYFMVNLGNPNLMNNLEEASDLFKKIIEFRGRG